MATWKVYGQHLLGQYGATAARRVDLVNDTLNISLHTVTYVPNQDTDAFFSAATNEVTGTGYTAGGVAATGKAISYDAATNEFRFVCADAVWGPGASIAGIRVAVLRKVVGTAATDPLIAYAVLDGDQTVSNGTYTLDIDPTTLFRITAA
jgi:predicted TIM-barrel enzyme